LRKTGSELQRWKTPSRCAIFMLRFVVSCYSLEDALAVRDARALSYDARALLFVNDARFESQWCIAEMPRKPSRLNLNPNPKP
jgi:hypothetical protein